MHQLHDQGRFVTTALLDQSLGTTKLTEKQLIIGNLDGGNRG